MGLDMYLNADVYIGGKYSFKGLVGGMAVSGKSINMSIDVKDIESVKLYLGSWRKANQIHKFFVDRVQEGIDDCKEYEVPYEVLGELRSIINEILNSTGREQLNNLIEDKLPPCEGFFFGETDYKSNLEDYLCDLRYTLEILDKADELYKKYNGDIDFRYTSSW